MNKLQMAYLHMQERVLAQMERSSELAGTIPGLNEVTEQLKAFLEKLRELRQVQEWNTRGVSERKQLVREELVEESQLVSSFFQEMSKRANMEHLIGLHKSASDIDAMKQELLVAYSSELEDILTQHAELFTELGYPEDRKAKFLELSMEFRSIKHVPREAIQVRKQATEGIKQLMEQIRELLEHRIDVLFKANEKQFPEPALAYFSARDVVMPASYSREEESSNGETDEFTDSISEEPSSKAAIDPVDEGDATDDSSNNALDDDSKDAS
ncbi:MAG: hypothetical protein ACPGED_08280 [Flavobacteriales bacterium]